MPVHVGELVDDHIICTVQDVIASNNHFIERQRKRKDLIEIESEAQGKVLRRRNTWVPESSFPNGRLLFYYPCLTRNVGSHWAISGTDTRV